MRRWMLFLPLMALIAAAAGLGLLMGGRVALTTETEVIERIAARYLDEAGPQAARSDCGARVAQSKGLWLVVTCETEARAGVVYFIDRFGRVADRQPLGERG